MTKHYTIHFENVGRYQRSWTTTVTSLNAAMFTRQVNQHAVVMSRDLEFNYDGATGQGEIVAGFRTIGTFRITVPTGQEATP
jgi:hypothetical protein